MTKTILPLCLLILFSGCSLHSLNRSPSPKAAIQDQYSIEISESNADFAPWWYDFERPALNALIEDGLESNQDIAAAVARLRQAEALARNTASFRLPEITIEGDTDKSWRRGDAQRGTFSSGAALDWEVDVFNRIGSALKADKLRAHARSYDVEAVQLSLSADIAAAYFGAVAVNNTLNLLQEQLRLDRQLLDILELRLKNGVGTSVEVLQQQSRVADSESLIPAAKANLRVFENRLDVLLGQVPDAQNRINPAENLNLAVNLPVIGVPADLLLNRPDLKAAQAELIAADADIAAAIADRLPSITLTGSYLYSDTANFTGPLASIMGSFVQPLVDWGKRKAEVVRNKAVYEEKLALFTQDYLEAVEDVENALYQEKQQREFIKRLDRRRSILQNTASETETRYKQGIDDYQPVLDALQELRQVERLLVSEKLNLINFRIQLHRAIGSPISSEGDENNA